MKHLALILIFSSTLLAQGLSGLFGGSSNAKRIQSVAVKSSLGCTDGQVLKYIAANTQFECQNDAGGSGSGDVGGGTSLTTAGAIPYVASSGTLAQATDFARSAAGRYTIYDSGGSGVTTLTVRAGAGQSTTNMFRLRNAGDTADMFNLWLTGSGTTVTASFNGGARFNGVAGDAGTLVLNRSASIGWTSTAFDDAAADSGIKRSSANNLAVTNGSSTNYWLLGIGGIQSGVTTWNDATSSGTVSSKSILGIAAPTLTASSSTTFTTASTLRIGGAPTASTNVTIGTPYALEVAAGNSYFGGTVTAGGAFSGTSVTASADFIGASTSCIYLGATGTDGSWRFCRSSNDLVVSRRESGSWVAKGTWAP